MQLFRRSLVSLAWILALCAAPMSLCAQISPELELLATHTAEIVAKTHAQRVLTATLGGCLLDVRICTAYDGALQASLQMSLPTVQFVNWEDVKSLVKKRGFLGMDVYSSAVLRAMAPETSAEILVTENLGWGSDGYELNGEIIDVHTDKSLNKFKAKVTPTVPNPGDEPTIIKDPETGISTVIWHQKKSKFPVFRYVSCERCPDPHYTPEARKKNISGKVILLATVTEQGMLQSINVVKSLDPGLDNAAMETMRTWRLKPAVGLDGNAISVRVPIEVTFKLLF